MFSGVKQGVHRRFVVVVDPLTYTDVDPPRVRRPAVGLSKLKGMDRECLGLSSSLKAQVNTYGRKIESRKKNVRTYP